MEMGKILSADVLDIIFDQRNKEYGAYDLRKNYQRRLTKSLVTMSLIVALLLITYLLVAAIKPKSAGIIEVKEVALESIADKKQPEQPIVPPPQKVIEPQIKTIKDMVPVIVKDDVHIDDPVPEQKDIEDAKIGNITTAGADDIGVVTSPVDQRTSVVDEPKSHDNAEKIFTGVEIEAKYPGGVNAWTRYIMYKLVYPQQAIDAGIQGTVSVRFIVDRDGHISNVEAISGPETLRATAVNIIKNSIYWESAIQNGQKVKSYKVQPITFKLNDDQ
jgi:protein TonB